MKKYIIAVLLLYSTIAIYAQDSTVTPSKDSTVIPVKKKGFFSKLGEKLTNKIANTVVNLFTKKTSSIKDAIVTINYRCNLYPAAIRSEVTALDRAAADIWKDGIDIISVGLWGSKAGAIYELEGSVLVDNKPMTFKSGVYQLVVKDRKTHTIHIQTSTGEKADFTVKPQLPIKIVSPSKNESLNLTKDVNLKFDNPAGSEGSQISVSFYSHPGIAQYGLHTINYFKSLENITIPYQNFSSNEDGGADYVTGSSYLVAERFSIESPDVKNIQDIQIISSYNDYVPVNVDKIGNVQIELGQYDFGNGYKRSTLNGTNNSRNISIWKPGDINSTKNYVPNVNLIKPDLTTAGYFSKIKKVAVIAFTTRGTELTQTVTTGGSLTTYSKGDNGDPNAAFKHDKKITIELQKKFPDLPVEFWTQISDDLYAQVTEQFKTVFDIEIIPVEKVLAAPTYPFVPEQTLVKDTMRFLYNYKGLKEIYGNYAGLYIAITNMTYNQKSRLLDELGVDAILIMDLDLTMRRNTDKVSVYVNNLFRTVSATVKYNYILDPTFNFMLLGRPEGINGKPSLYAVGWIIGKGTDINQFGIKVDKINVKASADEIDEAVSKATKNTNITDIEALPKGIRLSAIIKSFIEGLGKIKEADDQFGYNLVAKYK